MIDLSDIYYSFLIDKLAELKSDLTIIDDIFEGRPVETIENIKKWIANTDIKVIFHHPRDEAELPSYCIVLIGSSEADQVIGSSGDPTSEVLISNMEDGWIGSDSDIMRTNTSLPTDISQFYSSLEVKDGRRSCHVISNKDTSLNKGIWIDFEHSVLEGGYVSLTGLTYVTFMVKSSRVGSFLQFGFGEKAHEEHTFPFTITSKNIWERISIDIRSVPDRERDQLRYMSFKVINDDGYINIYVDRLMGEKYVGAVLEEIYLDNNYRIESWSNNAELTQMMYQISLWNMLKYRTYLETSWGLYEQRVEGGDIMPQPEFYPEFVYVRGLVHSCKTIELVPREGDLTALEVRLGKQDWGGR
jgi:hypothetical protein